MRLVSLKTSQAQCCFVLVLSKTLKGFHGYVPRSAKAAMGGPSLFVPMFQMRQGHESCYFKLFSETTQLRAEVLVRFSKNAHFRSQSREMYHVSSVHAHDVSCEFYSATLQASSDVPATAQLSCHTEKCKVDPPVALNRNVADLSMSVVLEFVEASHNSRLVVRRANASEVSTALDKILYQKGSLGTINLRQNSKTVWAQSRFSILW